MKKEDIRYIVIHCSDSPNHLNFDISDVDSWHKEKGWSGCGYHYVITRDGKLQQGRKLNQTGAHAYGYNSKSIGICLMGGKDQDGNPNLDMTLVQDGVLMTLLEDLSNQFPNTSIIPHSEISPKTCPNFNLEKWLNNGSNKK